MLLPIKQRNFTREIVIKATHSSGKGGQHINKVATRIELVFNVVQSNLLTDEEKQLVLSKLKNKINQQGELRIVVQSERSQLKNKEKAVNKLHALIEKTLVKPKIRRPTKPSLKSKEERLKSKKVLAQKKESRKKFL